jgi:hypothetical protein
MKINSRIKIKILNIFHKEWVKLKVFLKNLDLYFFMKIKMINLAKTLFAESYLRNIASD